MKNLYGPLLNNVGMFLHLNLSRRDDQRFVGRGELLRQIYLGDAPAAVAQYALKRRITHHVANQTHGVGIETTAQLDACMENREYRTALADKYQVATRFFDETAETTVVTGKSKYVSNFV